MAAQTQTAPGLLEIGSWKIASHKTHMMESRCTCPPDADAHAQCAYCRFSKAFDFPLPEEVFAANNLVLQHRSGFKLEFSAMDALKHVGECEPLCVAGAADWLAARPQTQSLSRMTPYDWTFTTSYKGSVLGHHKPETTEQRIDLESLKAQEKILFYDDVHLFADDYHDNGLCQTHVRVRVMPSGFFVLLRQFVRVDRVIVRVRDTRIHHRFEWDYVLREYSAKEASVADIVPLLAAHHLDERALFQTDKITMVADILPIVAERHEKISCV